MEAPPCNQPAAWCRAPGRCGGGQNRQSRVHGRGRSAGELEWSGASGCSRWRPGGRSAGWRGRSASIITRDVALAAICRAVRLRLEGFGSAGAGDPEDQASQIASCISVSDARILQLRNSKIAAVCAPTPTHPLSDCVSAFACRVPFFFLAQSRRRPQLYCWPIVLAAWTCATELTTSPAGPSQAPAFPAASGPSRFSGSQL